MSAVDVCEDDAAAAEEEDMAAPDIFVLERDGEDIIVVCGREGRNEERRRGMELADPQCMRLYIPYSSGLRCSVWSSSWRSRSQQSMHDGAVLWTWRDGWRRWDENR